VPASAMQRATYTWRTTCDNPNLADTGRATYGGLQHVIAQRTPDGPHATYTWRTAGAHTAYPTAAGQRRTGLGRSSSSKRRVSSVPFAYSAPQGYSRSTSYKEGARRVRIGGCSDAAPVWYAALRARCMCMCTHRLQPTQACLRMRACARVCCACVRACVVDLRAPS
jgi:hypothetical protein